MAKRMSGSVLLLATLTLLLIAGDVLVLAAQDPQNPPATPTPQTQTPRPRPSKKKSRGQVTTTTGDQTATPAEPTMPAQTAAPAQTTAPATPTEQPDLSGTYAGTFNCDPLGLTGDTTLTITGNQFTTADGKTGRIVASKTHGYTAVALQTGEVGTGPTAAPPTIVSLRARKSGSRLTLTPAAGSTMQCSFGPTRNVAKGRRAKPATPAATGAEVASPAEAGPTPADVTAPAKPAKARRGSTKPAAQPTTTPQPMPNPGETPTQPTPETPIPAQTPSPTPSPNPTPSGSPTPNPSPTPSGSPTPEPAPTATPSPSPSPRPGGPRG